MAGDVRRYMRPAQGETAKQRSCEDGRSREAGGEKRFVGDYGSAKFGGMSQAAADKTAGGGSRDPGLMEETDG